MQRQEVLRLVRVHQEELREMGVKSLDLFGSVARDRAQPNSDVDFLVEFSRPVGLFGLFRVQHYLEDLLGRSVDLGTRAALKAHLREAVVEDILRVF